MPRPMIAEPPAPTQRQLASVRLDALAALGAMVCASQCHRTLGLLIQITDPYARSTVLTGLIAVYFRAFEEVKDSEYRLSRRFSTKKIAGFDPDIHKSLLMLRNKSIAHAGHDLNDFDLRYMVINLVQNPPPENAEPIEMGVGSRAQASVPTGFEQEETYERLRLHLEALYNVSGLRLTQSLADHQMMYVSLKNSGKLNTDRPPRHFGQGETTVDPESKTLSIPVAETLAADPRNPTSIGLSYMSLFYQLQPMGDNRARLMQITKLSAQDMSRGETP